MIKDFETVRTQLKELADVLNAYKSEAVQLRLVELIFGPDPVAEMPEPDAGEHPARKTKSKSRRRKVAPAQEVSTGTGTDGVANAGAGKPGASKAARSRTGRQGPGQMLEALLGEGYFKAPRTINTIVSYCDTSRATKFTQQDLSGKLTRLVRENKLTRVKNSDGQYEYTQP